MEIITKNGDITKRLKLLSRQANLCDIITSISLRLPKIINHRNHLRHYRSTINEFREFYDNILIDIDFSENLSIPVKFEPQSLHWCHEQVTIHSGILKVGGKKSYHPYVSNERRHDQPFVHIVLEKMLEEVDMKLHSYIVIESDNCSVQYKSAQHFNNMQELADKYNTNLIRIFGIPEHGKGEVDHVGGIAKNVVRKEIAGGRFLQDASEIVACLQKKFEHYTFPDYVKEIFVEDVNEVRCNAALKVCKTIEGSSSFQVMLFKPNSDIIRATSRICICDLCKVDYGSCKLFQDYTLQVQILKETLLRSSCMESNTSERNTDKCDFLMPESICAVAADQQSSDTVWFIKIEGESITKEEICDDYGVKVGLGQKYLYGKFLEKEGTCRGGQKFKLMRKTTFFYKESVVYPFVNFDYRKHLYVISNNDFCDVISYVDHYGMAAL